MSDAPDRPHLIEEERLIIRHSGEIPEVAYHGTLHYLASDPEGPGISIDAAELRLLQAEVLERYRAIILRDLNPAFRGKRIYRGLARAAINWTRLNTFCARVALDAAPLRPELAEALLAFLRQECVDVRDGRPSAVNCQAWEVEAFALSLGLSSDLLPEGWKELGTRGS